MLTRYNLTVINEDGNFEYKFSYIQIAAAEDNCFKRFKKNYLALLLADFNCPNQGN